MHEASLKNNSAHMFPDELCDVVSLPFHCYAKRMDVLLAGSLRKVKSRKLKIKESQRVSQSVQVRQVN